MWITLLFFAQVGCEWVQISQQHYRKPFRPKHDPVLVEDADFEYEDETSPKTNKMYTNQSINDYKWKDSDMPQNNKGFVTRVEADDEYIIRGDKKTGFNKVNTNNALKIFNDHHDEDDDGSNAYASKYRNREQQTSYNDPTRINDKGNKVSIKTPHDDAQEVVPHNIPKKYGSEISESQQDKEESYHIIPNVGSIKKVHLDSRTVRTPILNEMTKKQYVPSHTVNPVEKEIFPSRPVIIWKSENQTKKVVPGIIQKVSKEDLERNPVEKISKYEEIPLNDKDHSINKNTFKTVQSSERISGESVEFNQVPDINFEKPVFITKEELEDEELVTISTVKNDDSDEETTKSIKKSKTEAPKPQINIKNKESPTPNNVDTMENVLKFMRIVTDTISRNTRRGVGSKVRYLENLQDTIMANIKHRIDTLWPEDGDQSSDQVTRKARSAATPRGGGHVEFPSSESALMTISFLTFAVYLIKLVLQVIHTYKNKAMMMMPAVVTSVGRTVAAVYRRPDVT